MNTQLTAVRWSAPHDLRLGAPDYPFDLVWHLYGPGRLIYTHDIDDMRNGALHRLQERLAPHFAALGINPTGVVPFDLVETMFGEHGLRDIPRATLGLRVLALSEALRRGLEKAGHVVPPQHPALPELAKYLADELERQKPGFVGFDRTAVTPHIHPPTKSEGDHDCASSSTHSGARWAPKFAVKADGWSKAKTIRNMRSLQRRLSMHAINADRDTQSHLLYGVSALSFVIDKIERSDA